MGEIPIQEITRIAGADLSAAQYLAVKLDNSGNMVKAGAGENAIGILQMPTGSGKAGRVMALGISFAILGDTVTAGANVAVDANAKIVTATGSAAVIGVALEGGAASERVAILLVTRTSAGFAARNMIVAIPVTLSTLNNATVLNGYVPAFAGSIKKFSLVTQTPASTAAKTASLKLQIAGVDVTGGVLSLTTAGCDTLGKVTDATAITAANTFTNAQAISVVANATAAAFVEGTGTLLLVIEQ